MIPNLTHVNRLVVLLYNSLQDAHVRQRAMYLPNNPTNSASASDHRTSQQPFPSQSSVDPWAMPARSTTEAAMAQQNIATPPPRPKAPPNVPAAAPPQHAASPNNQYANVPVPDVFTPPDPDEWYTNDKGVTMHRNRMHFKSAVKCKWCFTPYRTEWGTGTEPYDELRRHLWQPSRVSGNWTWQHARCPSYPNCNPPI